MVDVDENLMSDLAGRIAKIESLVSSVDGHRVDNSDYLNLVVAVAPVQPTSWWLVANGQKIDLQAGDNKIGRGSLPNASKKLSRLHATISVGANQTPQIVASGTNATLLDGKALTNGQPYDLNDKSVITLADYQVVFRQA
jgi:hypothetical protein